MEKGIEVEYFAVFSQQTGKQKEKIQTQANTVSELFCELKEKFQFRLAQEDVMVAINQQVAAWNTPLANGDVVLFIPPIAGG